MKIDWHKTAFFLTIAFYSIFYAPVGINETDGGFLSGLAWQFLSGKQLYTDIIYVRPPMPIWLRALELLCLPEHGQVLGERWIFYLKVAAYSWLAADLLAPGRRWLLASLGFLTSVHNYPPMAWHTIDGILFSVLGLWCLRPVIFAKATDNQHLAILEKQCLTWPPALGAAFVFAAMLCKQSFYPMSALLFFLLFWSKNRRVWLSGGLVFAGLTVVFLAWLWHGGLWEHYFRLTSGAARPGAALQHGLLDYFRINPLVGAGAAFFGFFAWRLERPKLKLLAWSLFLLWLSATYVWQVHQAQDNVPPYAQSRLLFWLAAGFCLFKGLAKSLRLLALLFVSWCSAISWGYNLPACFATPGVFAALAISEGLWDRAFPVAGAFSAAQKWRWLPALPLLLLLGVFRYAYEFVYRDGPRRDLNVPLGPIFPKLQGIWTDSLTADKYREWRDLQARFAGRCAVLPTFTQADFLADSPPLLPLDWVVERETTGDNALIFKILKEKKPTLLIEKNYGEQRLLSDPEFALTAEVLSQGERIGETRHFWIYRYGN